MLRKRKSRGQSTLEYGVLIAVIVAALLAINIYLKRGVQGKLRESTDQIGEQFEAGATEISRHSEHTGTTVQTVDAGVTKSDTTADTRTESGSETVAAW